MFSVRSLQPPAPMDADETNSIEYVDHLHEHFVWPCSINAKGHYNVPTEAKEGYRYDYNYPFFSARVADFLERDDQYSDARVEYRRIPVPERLVLAERKEVVNPVVETPAVYYLHRYRRN